MYATEVGKGYKIRFLQNKILLRSLKMVGDTFSDNNRAIVRAAMFVLRVETFKARALFAPRSRGVKKPLWVWGLLKPRICLRKGLNKTLFSSPNGSVCKLYY